MGRFMNGRRESRVERISVVLLAFSLLAAVAATAAVSPVWTRTYSGKANLYDVGRAIAVAPDGASVVVIGTTTIVDGVDTDIWLRKYTSAGKVEWTRKYGGKAGDEDEGWGVAVAPDGSIYAVGIVKVSGEEGNIWIRKYSADGTPQWTKIINGKTDDRDEGYDVAVDADGKVYVAGFISVQDENKNVWLRKYSPAGKKIWTKTYNGAAVDSDDRGNAVTVGPSGGIYVAGHDSKTAGVVRFWMRKYSASGKKLWTKTDADFMLARDVVESEDGSVFVTGVMDDAGSDALWLRRYTKAGKHRWTRTVGAPEYESAYGWGVVADSSGGACVAGDAEVTGLGGNVWLRSYSSKGKTGWTETYHGGIWDGGRAVAISPDGSIYVTGYTGVAGEDGNIWVRKYQ